MLASRLRFALAATQVLAVATFVRSIAFDRWITVLAAIILFAGAAAAKRGKTWGIGVALSAAISFPTAWALGMAPFWFCFVGAVGAAPFALTSRAIARFDAKATALGVALAGAVGVSAALAWHLVAPFLFANVPELRPGWEPSHGVLLATLGAAALAWSAWKTRVGTGEAAVETRVRIEERHERVEELADEADIDEEEPLARRRSSV